MRDREAIRKAQERFERQFPQLFFAIYAEAFEEAANLRQYGFWLLNHAAFDDVDIERPNECGILLTIDVNARALTMTSGYSLLPYITEESSFDIMAHAHASLLEGKWAEALTEIMDQLTRHLKKKYREVRRNPERLMSQCGQRLLDSKRDDPPKPLHEGLKVSHSETEEVAE